MLDVKPVVTRADQWHLLYSVKDVTFEIVQAYSRWARDYEALYGQIFNRDFEDLWLSLESLTLKNGKRIRIPLDSCPAKRFIMNDIKVRG